MPTTNQSVLDTTNSLDSRLTWLQLIKSDNERENNSAISAEENGAVKNNQKDSVSINHTNGRNLIQFNLPSPADSLVTVFDMEGKIISIQKFRSHKNIEELTNQNQLNSYIVRVMIKYENPYPGKNESHIKIVHLR